MYRRKPTLDMGTCADFSFRACLCSFTESEVSHRAACGIRNFRSRIAYNRWWEGGTLLQQTRGEWFNGFSSLIVPCLETNRNHCSEQWTVLWCITVSHSSLESGCIEKSRPFAIHLRTWQRKWRNSSIFLHLGLHRVWRVWIVWLRSEWLTHLPHQYAEVRLMSMLYCCALQQVSPDRDRWVQHVTTLNSANSQGFSCF